MKYEKKFGIDRQRGQTWTFACKDAGGEDKLARAIRNGEVEEVTGANNIKYYVKQEIETGTERARVRGTKVSGKVDWIQPWRK